MNSKNICWKGICCGPALWIGLMLMTAPAPAQQEKVFPVPEGNPRQLFYLQRTVNANTLVYELNCAGGQIDRDNPIHVYWIRYGEQGQKAELNAVQRNYAYGVKTSLVAEDVYQVSIVAYKKYIMHLKKARDDKYYVFVIVNGRPAILKKIFLQVEGGPFWSPNIRYAELQAADQDTGEIITERITIQP